MAPIHPGEMLMEDFLVPLGVSQYRLAQAIGVPARRINEIVHGTRRISEIPQGKWTPNGSPR
jgi:addiction module HigA family antidote